MVSLNLPTSPSAPLAHRDRARKNTSDGVRPQGRAHESPRQCILVALDWVRDKDPSTSLGLGSIAAAVREVAPTKELYFNVATGEIKAEQVAENILQSAEDLGSDCGRPVDVALGSFVWNEGHVYKISRILKERGFPGRLMLGGPQVSYAEAGMLELAYPFADVFIRGYGEAPISMLMSGHNPLEVDGVHVSGRADNGRKAEVDLQELPSPFLSGVITPNKFMRWETKRGCPQRCSFCQHRESSYTRLRNRSMSWDRVRKEANWFANNGVTDDLAILDPTFNTGHEYLTILKELRNSRFQGSLSLQLKGDLMNDAFLDEWTLLSSSGVKVVGEYGLQTIHSDEQKAIRRRDNLKKFAKTMVELGSRGLPFEISIIFGLPLQTLDSFKRTVGFCLSVAGGGKGIIRAFPLMLLRGTEMEIRHREWGIMESSDSTVTGYHDGMPYVIKSNTFTYLEWVEMRSISRMLETTEGDHPLSL